MCHSASRLARRATDFGGFELDPPWSISAGLLVSLTQTFTHIAMETLAAGVGERARFWPEGAGDAAFQPGPCQLWSAQSSRRRFAVLNLTSDNPGMRRDIEKRVIGYAPQDGVAPTVTQALEGDELVALDYVI
jgi:hypothetical protein